MYGAVSLRLNQDFVSTGFAQNPSTGVEVCLADNWMKGKRKGRKEGRTDGWTNGDIQADREIDIMKLTFIFLNIVNASRAQKIQVPSIRHRALVRTVILRYLKMYIGAI